MRSGNSELISRELYIVPFVGRPGWSCCSLSVSSWLVYRPPRCGGFAIGANRLFTSGGSQNVTKRVLLTAEQPGQREPRR